jgi:hypothetical protein
MVRQFLPNNNEKCYRNFFQKFLGSKHALNRLVMGASGELYDEGVRYFQIRKRKFISSSKWKIYRSQHHEMLVTTIQYYKVFTMG